MLVALHCVHLEKSVTGEFCWNIHLDCLTLAERSSDRKYTLHSQIDNEPAQSVSGLDFHAYMKLTSKYNELKQFNCSVRMTNTEFMTNNFDKQTLTSPPEDDKAAWKFVDRLINEVQIPFFYATYDEVHRSIDGIHFVPLNPDERPLTSTPPATAQGR